VSVILPMAFPSKHETAQWSMPRAVVANHKTKHNKKTCLKKCAKGKKRHAREGERTENKHFFAVSLIRMNQSEQTQKVIEVAEIARI
jgi:hypothetical protein